MHFMRSMEEKESVDMLIQNPALIIAQLEMIKGINI